MHFQKTKTGFHRIFARRDNFVNVDTELPDCASRTALWDEPPSLERVADAGEVLPFDTRARLDMEHCEFGSGHECDLQGMREGHFAGLRKIRRMKNGLHSGWTYTAPTQFRNAHWWSRVLYYLFAWSRHITRA